MTNQDTPSGEAIRGTLAIVGRPNVGKSTLFNRLTGSRRALVDPTPGVTRDRNYGFVDWTGTRFRIIDTGGVEENPQDPLLSKMRKQVVAGITEADLVLFLVDGRAGLLPEDEEVGRWLREQGKPVILAVNKADTPNLADLAAEFYSLGFDPVVPVSAESGQGIGDLLDVVVAQLPDEMEESPEIEAIRVAIIGKPNVGKSSLVNRIAGEERSVVHEMPGTTRDTVDVLVRVPGREEPFLLLDTAGMKRRKKWSSKLDAVAAGRVERVIRRADVAILMMDAVEGPTHQDAAVAGMVEKAGCGLILVLNKWDLVEEKEARYGALIGDVRHRLRHVEFAPILTISVKEGERLPRLLELVETVARNRRSRVATSELNRTVQDLMQRVRPPSGKGGAIKLKYVTQASANPPTFILFLGGRGKPPESYRRYIANKLRGLFPLEGTPIRVWFRGGDRS